MIQISARLTVACSVKAKALGAVNLNINGTGRPSSIALVAWSKLGAAFCKDGGQIRPAPDQLV